MLLNRQPKNAGFIFSVFQHDLSKGDNIDSHDRMLKYLISESIPHKIVMGKYTHSNGTEVNELSFYVETNDKIDQHTLYDFVKTQCINANQESFLSLSSDRKANLILINGKSYGIGVFTSVSEVEAENAEAYTYCPKLESYYICK